MQFPDACPKCKRGLTKNPAYAWEVARTCSRHGDFFLYREKGKEDEVVFRPFVRDSPKKSKVKKSIKPGILSLRRPRRQCQVIQCDQTREIFGSQMKVAAAMHISQGDLSKHLNGWRDSVGGYTFTRLAEDGLGNLVPIPRIRLQREFSNTRVNIRCDQTGQVFRSIREAALVLGLARSSMYCMFNGSDKSKTVRGYTFTKISSQ